jgi:hypothetical protein
MVSGGSRCDSVLANPGTGGRVGVFGAAFSLSPDSDSWLEPGSCCFEGVCGTEADPDSGGLGKSATI